MKLIPGFRFRETMRGSFHRLASPVEDCAIEIALTVETDSVRKFARDRLWTIHGTLDAEGLATHAAVHGTIEMRLFDEHRLPYRCAFIGDDGAKYELRGQKEIVPIAPIDSMTVLPASIYDAGSIEIARAVLRFDARNELKPFLKSFRLAFG